MFAQLSILTVLSLATWVQPLLLQIPVDWHSSSQVNISWTNTATDPIFALQLFNTDEFHDTFSIANDLQPSSDFASFELGVIPVGTYTLRAINETNANDIFDETPSFSVLAAPSSTASSSTPASTSSAASSARASGSASGSSTLTVPAASTTTGFGQTVSASSTAAASGSNSGSASDSSASSSATSAANFNGAASIPRIAPLALTALGVVAGAALVL